MVSDSFEMWYELYFASSGDQKEDLLRAYQAGWRRGGEVEGALQELAHLSQEMERW